MFPVDNIHKQQRAVLRRRRCSIVPHDDIEPQQPTTTSAMFYVLLPHKNSSIFYLTDSGLETQLIFKDGFELPEFAPFPLLFDQRGWEHSKAYYRRHAALAATAAATENTCLSMGYIFESMTWRASTDWLKKLGYNKNHEDNMQAVCNKAIQVMSEVRDEFPQLARRPRKES
jgi:hypothetical protein